MKGAMHPEIIARRLKHFTYYAVIGVAVVTTAVRLASRPFWIDEAIAVMPAKTVIPYQNFDTNFMPWQIKNNVWDPAFPLYRVTLGIFTRAFGFSEASTRGFSLLFGVLTLAVFFVLIYRLRGYDFALRATALLAALPAFFGLGSEARYYSFAMFWIVGVIYAYQRLTEVHGVTQFRLFYASLLGAILSHAMVYLILPLVVILLLCNKVDVRKYWTRADFLLFSILVGCYVVYFSDTLPFLHTVDCSNRSVGCDRTHTYYLGSIWNTLAGKRILYETFQESAGQRAVLGLLHGAPGSPLKELSLAHLAFVSGGFWLWKEIRSGKTRLSRESILLLLLVLPCAVLTFKEYKAHKYYLIFALPVIGYVLANSFGILSGLAGARRQAAELALFLAIVGSLRIDVAGAIMGGDNFRRELSVEIAAARADNFERMDAQVRFFRKILKPEDAVVATMDDASLGHYLNRFVYSFLNNRHDDAFFLGLLEKTAAAGGKVYFVDMLPEHNYCLTDEPEPRSVDCRRKYPEFYSACSSGRNPNCIAVKPAELP